MDKLTDREIFNELFEVAKTSHDPEGVVAAALVREDKILIALPSSDDGSVHAEDRVLQEAEKSGIQIQPGDILYTTLEPCNTRTERGTDCVSLLIRLGIKSVVYAAKDPPQSEETQKRLTEHSIHFRQVSDKDIIQQAVDLFNSTQSNPEKPEI